MIHINTHSLTLAGKDWLANSRHQRILHFFDQACNLINERRDVLSIVTPKVGNGPFNLVMENEICFSEYINLESPISTSLDQLSLGALTINTLNASIWSPRLDWEGLYVKRNEILNQLRSLPLTIYQADDSNRNFAIFAHSHSTTDHLQSLTANLASAVAAANIPACCIFTSQLAGLGIGLTPAGDDFILGAVLAAWIIHPPETASLLAKEITNTAAPLTTSLSAAWLRSAGKGEAGILWHNFFDALAAHDPMHIQEALDKINAVGETSGADALAGFIGVVLNWMESKQKELTLHEDTSG